MAGAVRARPRHIEDDVQKTVVAWAAYIKTPCGKRLGDYLYAVPNGGKRDAREAARMKAQGVKAGVSDLVLALPCGPYHGLFLELKRPQLGKQRAGTASPEQLAWIERMRLVGYRAEVAAGVSEAQTVLLDYLALGVAAFGVSDAAVC